MDSGLDTAKSNLSSAETPDAKTDQVTKIDLDDNETREKNIAEAIDLFKIRKRNDYSGWVMCVWFNEKV